MKMLFKTREFVSRLAGLTLFFAVAAPLWSADTIEGLVGDQKVVKLADGFKFTEGPAWSPQGFLLFSDIPNTSIVRHDADGISTYLSPSGRANGLVFDEAGNLYACQGGARRVVKIGRQDGKIEVLADQYGGKPLNGPNDLALDSVGGLYFTDPYYGPDMPLDQPVMGVYYIDSAGIVTRVIEDRERPNGILVSNDGKTLYVAEPNKAQLWGYPIEKPGKLGAGRLLFTGDAKLDGGGPDGMALDAQGRIYATYSGIVVLDGQGKLIGRIPVPEHPANCTFGGADGRTLFITARTGLYSVNLSATGAAPAATGPRPRSSVTVSAAREGGASVPVRLVSQQKAEEGKSVKLGDLKLVTPPSWKQQEPNSRLRLGQFEVQAVEGDASPAELTVSTFGGDGGGIDPNLTRWVGQFAEKDREFKAYTGKGEQGTYYLLDISGTYNQPVGPPVLRQTKPVPDSRMLGVILVIEGSGNYFLKLTGPDKTVAAQRDAIRKSITADADAEKAYELKQ
ncbi:MAG: SMP-30/gluconolactonase/LRE family protein [Planctomycetaceae bacterium]|nr:SMP-30/gluconolactonase/LRE family protein [Planctomycetaceae bacterium]